MLKLSTINQAGSTAQRSGLRRALLLGASLTAVPFAWASPAFADAASTSDAPSPAAAASSDIVVTAYRYLDPETSGITNLPLPVEQVPQSISLINNDFAKAADFKNMADLAQYTTGALWASYSGSYGNQVWLRGFSANYAIDGMTVGNQITEPDPATLERYEVVKGPASVVYGDQSPGGIINLVSKSATPATPNYIEALGGSWGRWRLEGQLAGKLNADGSVRAILVAAHEEGGSFVNAVKFNKTVAYGGLDVDATSNLSGYVRVNYQRTADTPFSGIPVYATGVIPALSPSFLFGSSTAELTVQTERVDTGLTWRPGDLWSVKLKALYQHVDYSGGNAYTYGTMNPAGNAPFGGEHYNDWHTNDFTVDASVVRQLDDLHLPGSSISADIRHQHYQYFINEDETGSTGTVNIFAGQAAVINALNAYVPTVAFQENQVLDFLTASGQVVLKVAQPLTLVGGISYSHPDINQTVNTALQNYNPGGQVDYRGGIIVQPVPGLNIYGSYSESYQPNYRLDPNFNVLPPVSGEQLEAGVKYSTPGNRLLLTAAVFQIRENNVADKYGAVNGQSVYIAEGVRHRGFELEANGRITAQWQVHAGLSYIDATVTNDPVHPINDGERRPFLPRTTANLFTTYTIGHGFDVSGGVRHVDSVITYQNSSSTQTASVPGYTLFDAAAGYSFDKWRLQLNVKNIANKQYYVTTPVFASLGSGIMPGEPRSFTVSVKRDF